jgi:uncharacterized membrane protein (UPF0127 family)
MKSKNTSIFISFIVILIAVILMVRYVMNTGIIPSFGEFVASSTQRSTFFNKGLVNAPFGSVRVGFATTEEERNAGLGGKDGMAIDEGLLFTFDEPGVYGFWMKDMKFPIDFVWIAADKSVVGVTPNISPESYPEAFYPDAPVKYVLEINSGRASTLGISSGTILVF